MFYSDDLGEEDEKLSRRDYFVLALLPIMLEDINYLTASNEQLIKEIYRLRNKLELKRNKIRCLRSAILRRKKDLREQIADLKHKLNWFEKMWKFR